MFSFLLNYHWEIEPRISLHTRQGLYQATILVPVSFLLLLFLLLPLPLFPILLSACMWYACMHVHMCGGMHIWRCRCTYAQACQGWVPESSSITLHCIHWGRISALKSESINMVNLVSQFTPSVPGLCLLRVRIIDRCCIYLGFLCVLRTHRNPTPVILRHIWQHCICKAFSPPHSIPIIYLLAWGCPACPSLLLKIHQVVLCHLLWEKYFIRLPSINKSQSQWANLTKMQIM